MGRQYPVTKRVEMALREAQQAARRFHHEFIGTEHLLLGVLADPSGEIQSLLRTHGSDADAIRVAVARTVRARNSAESSDQLLPYTSRAQQVLGYAAQEADELRHEAVDLDHLLLGLRVEEKGIAAQMLSDAGIQADWLRPEVARRHQSERPPAGEPPVA